MAKASRIIESFTMEGFTVDGGLLVPWDEAPRAELLSAWGLTKATLGAHVLPEGRPLSFTAEELRRHLRTAHGGALPVAIPSAVVPDPVTVPTTADPVTVAPTYSDPVAALSEFVRMTAATSVDEDRVRALIDEAVAALPSVTASPSVVINVPTRPEPVTLSGTVHERFGDLVDVLTVGSAAYLYGPPATGKSHAAEAVAEALGVPFVGMLACSPDMMPSSVRGFVDATGTYQRTAFRDAYEHGGLFVIDEIDNAPSAITVGLVNTAIASGSLTFPDGTVRKHAEFRVVATANTYGTGPTAEFVGRFPLDPSTLSRFVRIAWDYSERVDRAVVASSGASDAIVDGIMSAVTVMRRNIDGHGLRAFVTSRDAKAAASLLSVGWTWDKVLDACLVPAGITPDQRRQILADVRPVSA